MRGLNRAEIIGNLGSDPEVRHTEGGVAVCTLSVASSERWKSRDGGTEEKTEWHRVTLWRGLAEIAEQHLSKGDAVYIAGSIRTKTWKDRDDIKRYTTEIEARELIMIGNKGSQPANLQSGSELDPVDPVDPGTSDDDDLPF